MTLLLPGGTEATLDDVRAWLRARDMKVSGRLLGTWVSVGYDGGAHPQLQSIRGGTIGSVYPFGTGWAWVVRGVNSFGQVCATERDARAAVEAAAGRMGWRWP